MKQRVKSTLYLLSYVLISPLLFIYVLIYQLPGDHDKLFEAYSQLFSLIPGRTGNFLRAAYYHFALRNCPLDILVAFHTLMSQKETEISSGVYIGPQCNVGLCKIGKNTLLGSGVHVVSGKSQHFTDNLDVPIKDQGGKFQKIEIGEDCWIGNASIIMANIGSHSIVGAGSVVVDNIPAYAIAVGNPARVIKFRNEAGSQGKEIKEDN